MARPASVAAFERLFLASLALGPIQAAIGWEELRARAAPAEMLALLGLVFFTLAGLALLVSRGRSRPAKWVLVLLCALGLPLLAAGYGNGTLVGWPPLAFAQAALQVAGLGLLFTGDARSWLAGAA